MDLICWQKAMDLVTEIYRLTKQLPKEEVFGLASQLRRAAVSIPSNIAEGQGRLSKGEFRTFFWEMPEDHYQNWKLKCSYARILTILLNKKLQDCSTWLRN